MLGYSGAWDRWERRTGERPHDVVYLGTTDDRRSRLLAFDVGPLDDAEVLFAMPPHEPMVRSRPDFFMGEAKLELLRSSKVLLNLHRGASRSLEWVRVLEAMCNGCVVVSEHSVDFAPLRPGAHLLLGSPRTLVHLARSILADPARLASVRTEAYELLRSELGMRSSALALAQLADEVRGGGPRRRPLPRRPSTWAAWPPDRAGRVVGDEAPGPARTAGRPVPPPPPASASTAGPPGPREPGPVRAPDDGHAARGEEDVDVVVVQWPGSPDASVALGPLLRQIGEGDRVHVCLDGVHGGALPDDGRVAVYGGPAHRGAACLAYEVVGTSDAPLVLVLEAGDQLVPRALDRLRRALRAHAGDAAYGMVVTPEGLLASALPFEPSRLAASNYLAAAALWRRDALVALGGWPEDPATGRTAAWDLWRRLAGAGGSAWLVPRPLVYQAFSHTAAGAPGPSAVPAGRS